MKPSITLVTLGVRDFARSHAFYKEILGWATTSKDSDPVAFFELNNILLGLYPYHLLAEDAKVPADGTGFGGITLAQNLGSKQEVDALFADLKKKNVRIAKAPVDAEWGGYSGYFADPDGYLWEVAWNPFWTLTDTGQAHLTKPA